MDQDFVGFGMDKKKYALVFNGVVQSVFYSDNSKEAFPDIADQLYEVPERVGCNWKFDVRNMSFQEPPQMEENAQGELVEVVEERPWWKFW